MHPRSRLFAVLVAAFVPAACRPPATVGTAPGATAIATLRDLSGAQVGNVTLSDTYAGVLLVGTVSGVGLGAHGMHVHETGACTPPFTTAGGHFNPDKKKHGFKNSDGHHAGDLPNVDTPAAGQHKFESLLSGVTLAQLLDGDGAAIVLHTAGDDYLTDPSGNSGGRIACGVIARR
jgi:Cu-Zn family superoxide dismutase